MKTKYVSRCRNCGHKGKLNVDSDGEITCGNCRSILGARVSPNLDITILVGWADMTRWRKRPELYFRGEKVK